MKRFLPLLLLLSSGIASGATVDAPLVVDFFSIDVAPAEGRAEAANPNSPNLVAGRLPNGDLARIVLVFELPAEVTAENLREAELELYFFSSFLKKRIPAQVRHSTTYARVNAHAEGGHDRSFVDTGKVIADGGSRSDRSYRVKVTDFVRLDAAEEGAQGRRLAAFRIALQHEVLPEGERLLFAASESDRGHAPRLILTYRD